MRVNSSLLGNVLHPVLHLASLPHSLNAGTVFQSLRAKTSSTILEHSLGRMGPCGQSDCARLFLSNKPLSNHVQLTPSPIIISSLLFSLLSFLLFRSCHLSARLLQWPVLAFVAPVCSFYTNSELSTLQKICIHSINKHTLHMDYLPGMF